ncbi:MAG: MMPL family transporter [Gammaproteobacteria bacterium]|nr:MMPL family transporter [Gammaproteobacteria bacterium]MBT5644380.1 MMPL family transporter [Gammaproteobacteria bacterium]
MIKNFSHLYFYSILKNPKRMLLIMFVIMIGIGSYTTNFKLDASADSLILENDSDLLTYKDTIQRYSTKDFIVMTYTPKQGEIFDRNHLLLIKRLKEKLLSIKNISSVVSIVDVPLVQSSETSLTEMINNVPTILSKDIDIGKAENEILASPIYKNLIISSDGTTTALQINLKSNENLIALNDQKRILTNKKIHNDISVEEEIILAKVKQEYLEEKNSHNEDTHKLLKSVRLIQTQFSEKNNVELRLGGIPMIADDMIMYVKNDLINFGLGVFLFIVITLIIIFRKLKWVVLPILSCIYSVLFMIGLLGLLNWQVTVISSNFISLMLILTLSMNIHLIVRYRQLSSSSPSQYDAISLTVRQMVWPCLYTALTTIVAFASLILSDIKPVSDFGYMMTFGLIVTFLTSFILLPCILSLLAKEEEDNHENNSFGFTKFLAYLTIDKGKYIVTTTLIIFLLTIYGVSQLRVENSFINYFKSNTEIYKGMKQIDKKLGGTTPLDIVIKFDDKKQISYDEEFGDGLLEDDQDPDSQWFTVKKIDEIKIVHDYLDSLPEIGKVLSLASSIRVAEQLNENEQLSGMEMALLYKRVPKEVKSMAIDPYISIENNEARISARILDSKEDIRRNDLINKIENDMENKLGFEKESYFLTGILILYNNMLQSLFDSQILSLGFVMIGIFFMFLILFKSVVLSIIGIIPNLLAATFVLGLMGLINLPLDMMTITIAAIAIGIAVDNSIHYIYRFREEYRITKNYELSLYKSHDSIGRAIFFTSITIIFGFSILIMSNFVPTVIFGLLTGLAMLIALLAVLTLLPKLLISLKPFKS